MNNKKNHDPYAQPKKPVDKNKLYIHPCNKGAKCTYRKVDQDGYMIKNYCTFLHYPHDLCPDEEDCQFFQSGTCLWKHLTKPVPKPVEPVEIKTPLAQFIKMEDPQSEFPALGADANKKNTQKLANKPVQNHSQATKPQSQTSEQKFNKNTTIPSNVTNKITENTRSNPQSNSQLNVKSAFTSNQVKSENKSNPELKIQQNISTLKEPLKYLNSQKKTLQNNKIDSINGFKEQTQAQHQPQAQSIRQQSRQNREMSSVPIHLQSNVYQAGQRQVVLSQQIERLAKEVLRYNASKNHFDYGDYENTVKLAQILKLSNDLRPNYYQFSSLSQFQPYIQFESQPPMIRDPLLHIRYERSSESVESKNSPKAPDTQISNTFKQLYQQQVSNNQSSQIIQTNPPVTRRNPKMEETNKNQENKPIQKRQTSTNNKKILSQEEFSELSIDSKYPAISQYLLNVFFSFLNEEESIVFKFQVLKNQLEIIQKFYDSENGIKKTNNQKYYIYSLEVLQQSCFDQLCETITNYPYEVRKQQANHEPDSSGIKKRLSLINQKEDSQESLKPSQIKIKQFFEHLFQYIRFYFQNLKKEFKDKTLEALDIFFKPIQLPDDIIPANSPQILTNDPNHFKGPIYVGGMRNICMRFFARIFLLFLKNEQFMVKKMKKLITSKGQTFDFKAVLRFIEAKREQVALSLIGKQYEGDYECNKKKKPMDQKILEKEARNSLLSEMIVRSHHQIDQIMLSQKDMLLSWESMKQYIELWANGHPYAYYYSSMQIEPGQIKLIKMICKGKIEIESTDRKRYNMKEKNRFKFLKNFFIQRAIDSDPAQTQRNEFISNQLILLAEQSYATILADGKYFIEQPIESHNIQIYENQITKLLKKQTPQNTPVHSTKIYYFARGNTGLGSCDLQAIAQNKFFKDKILEFTKESEYIVYCNQKHGFYGPDSMDTFKIRIYRENGTVDFLNARNLQQCEKYFTQICEIIQNTQKTQTKIDENRTCFFIKTKTYKAPLTYLTDATDELTKKFFIQSKDEKSRKYKRDNLSIITWNLKRVFQNDNTHRQIPLQLRFKNIVNDLKHHKADFVCLQEVKDFKKALQEVLCEQNQLYYMPFHEDIGDFETLILTRFPVKYFSMKLGSTKMACCEFEIQSYPQIVKQQKKAEQTAESSEKRQEKTIQQIKKLSVLVMSIHLKCTEMDSEDNFLASIQTRENQLHSLEQFFTLNEKQSSKKYDLVIMAGDFNIDDEAAEYKENGQILHQYDHNEDFLTYPPYFDLQAELHPETLETLKTYLYKGRMENGKYVTGGSRIDRILIRTHSKTNVKDLITELSEISLVGDYSLRDKENVNETNFDKFTRSPSDHFGVYMEILFNL